VAKGRNAGEEVGNHRYFDGVAGEPGAVARSVLLVSPMSDARVPTLAPILISTAMTSQPAACDNSSGDRITLARLLRRLAPTYEQLRASLPCG